MAVLNIKDERAHRLARELADRTGASLTSAVRSALEHELERTMARQDKASLIADLNAIIEAASKLPVLDPRTPDEIIGYDENGLPS